ncbi:MAG: M28 family peptidase [Patescibacteria group bacterium]
MSRSKIHGKLTGLIFGLSLILAISGAVPAQEWSCDGELAYAVTAELTRPDYGGRMTGTPGYEKAAEYVAGQLKALGVQPAAGQKYLQTVGKIPPLPTMILASLQRLGPDGAMTRRYRFGQDFLAMPQAAPAVKAGPAVFIGYGITAKDKNYDDYAGLDVKGKVAVAFQGAPSFLPAAGDPLQKLDNARAHGAAVLILVDHPREARPKVEWNPKVMTGKTTLVLAEKALGEDWLAAAGLTPAGCIEMVEAEKKPVGRALGFDLRLSTVGLMGFKQHPAGNVLGLIPGASGVTGPHLLLCAHLDHMGTDPDGVVYPGASDNASGVGVVLEAAAFLSRPENRLPVPVVVAFFAGEELGFLGANEYLQKPALPLTGLAAVLNVDVMGGPPNLSCEVDPKYTGLRGDLAGAAEALGGLVRIGGLEKDHASDHLPFHQKGIPAAMLSNLSRIELMHIPEDDLSCIERQTLSAAASYLVEAARRAAEAVQQEGKKAA